MLIDKDKFQKKVDKLDSFPAFHGILDKFNEMVQDPTISMGQIGDLISQDVALSMKILKLVNSAFYGFPGRISTITHALVLLGYDVVKGLILSATVFDLMSEKWADLFKHSLAVSKASGLICERRSIPDAEEIGLAGLLHDIGKVVLLVEEPDIYQKVVEGASKRGIPLYMAEQKLMGFDHSEVAGWLCERWHLPQRLTMPLTYHHRPAEAEQAAKQVAVVFMADNLVKALGYGTQPGAKVSPVPDEVTELLQIDRDLLAELVEALENELEMMDVEA